MAGYHSEYEKSLKEAGDELKLAIDIYAEKIRKAVNAYEAEKLKAKEKASGIFENKEVN